jgi:hypothetical protein
MNGRQAKKIRKELGHLKRQMIQEERKKVAEGFRVFVNKLNWWNRLKLCREIMRRKL